MTRKRSKRRWGSVRRLPSGRFQARYRHPVTGIEHTAPYTFRTATEADDYLAEVRVDIDRGAWRDPKLGMMTFAEWAEEYMTGTQKRATTTATNRAGLKNHLVPAFGHMSMASIRPLDIRRFVEGMQVNGYAPSTIRTVYALLRAVMNAAVSDEVILRSPCKTSTPKDSKTQMRVVTSDELRALAEAIQVEFRPMIYLAGVMGLRWSEVAGLRVGRLDLLGRTISIVETAAQVGGFTPPKTASSRRTLTLPSFLLEMLAEHLARRGLTRADPESLVFVAPRGGRLHASTWSRRYWIPATKMAGMPGFHFHWLRHTSVALMVEANAHPRVIQHRLGHSSWSTTMDTYGHFFATADDGVTDRLDDMFSGGAYPALRSQQH
jgi:integrase